MSDRICQFYIRGFCRRSRCDFYHPSSRELDARNRERSNYKRTPSPLGRERSPTKSRRRSRSSSQSRKRSPRRSKSPRRSRSPKRRSLVRSRSRSLSRRPSSYMEERYRSRTSSSYNYWLSSSTKCRYFLSIGCKYGDHCQFRHERQLKSKSRSPERRFRSRSRSAVRRYRSRSRGYDRKQRSRSQSPKTSSKSKNENGVKQRIPSVTIQEERIVHYQNDQDKSNTKDGKDSASNSNAIEAMVVNKETISMDKSLVVEICNTTKNKEVAAQRKEVTLKEMNPLYFKLMENPLVFDNASSSDKHSNDKYKKETEIARMTEAKRCSACGQTLPT